MWKETLVEDSEERGGITELVFSESVLAATWRRDNRRAGAEGCSPVRRVMPEHQGEQTSDKSTEADKGRHE